MEYSNSKMKQEIEENHFNFKKNMDKTSLWTKT